MLLDSRAHLVVRSGELTLRCLGPGPSCGNPDQEDPLRSGTLGSQAKQCLFFCSQGS